MRNENVIKPSSSTSISLKQWIEETRRKIVKSNPTAATSSSPSLSEGCLALESPQDVLEYVKLALPVALKLVEFLVQTDAEHCSNANSDKRASKVHNSEGKATAIGSSSGPEYPSTCPQGFKSTASPSFSTESIATKDFLDGCNLEGSRGNFLEAPIPLSKIHIGAVKVHLSTSTTRQQQHEHEHEHEQLTQQRQSFPNLQNSSKNIDFSSLNPQDEAILHSDATLPLQISPDIITPNRSITKEADNETKTRQDQSKQRSSTQNLDSVETSAVLTNNQAEAPAQVQAAHAKNCTNAPTNDAIMKESNLSNNCTTSKNMVTKCDFDNEMLKQSDFLEPQHGKNSSEFTSASGSKNSSSLAIDIQQEHKQHKKQKQPEPEQQQHNQHKQLFQQELGGNVRLDTIWDDFEIGILNEMKEYHTFIGFDHQFCKETDDAAILVDKCRVLSVSISSQDHDPNYVHKYYKTDFSRSTNRDSSYYHDKDYGCNASRLVSLGIIFYELFSNQEPPEEMRALLERDISLANSFQIITSLDTDSCSASNSSDIACGDIALSGAGGRNFGTTSITGMSSASTSSKVRRKSSQSVKSSDEISPFILNLELASLPQSICMLVAHLLGCAGLDARGASKDSYKSLEEVRFDLELMIRDPTYLEDIKICEISTHAIDENILYGREEAISKCETFLEQNKLGECSGVLISGEAGVGKSQLTKRLRQTVLNQGGLFLAGKFDQSKDVIPFSVVSAAFNTSCHEFLQRSTQNQKKDLVSRLESSLGFQARTLMAIIPSLQCLMTYIPGNSSIFSPAPPSQSCVNVEHQTHFLLYMLLESLSIVLSAPVVCCFDDIQFADMSSLGFMTSLLIYSSRQKNLFFIGCCRDEIGEFSAWLDSQESGPTLSRVHLNNLNIDAVNSMLSHELHLTPRLTLSLAEILFHKTLGNPFFLRKLLETLKEEGSLYFSMPKRRWIWDTDRIQRMKVSEGVVELLTKQMSSLSQDLQTVLKIASCIGGSIDKSTMVLLMKDAQIQSPTVTISEAKKKGFFNEIESKLNFVHDKVQQAAYSLIPQEQREKDHLRYGLAICSSILADLNDGKTPDDLLFVAMNQINRGASEIAKDPSRKPVIAKLNLKAASCAMKLSDFSSAFNYCVHGVRNLYEDHWQSQYELSLQLCDQGARAAGALGNVKMVKYLTSKVQANARTYEHKVPSLYSTAKTLRESALYEEAKDCSLAVLRNLGQDVDALMNDDSFITKMQTTKSKLILLDDDAILTMKQVEEGRVTWIMKFYLELMYNLQHMQSSKMGIISIQMMDMTLNNGLSCTSPLAFAIFGYLLVSVGDPFLGYRLGKLALNLMRKLNLIVELSSTLTSIVYGLISWAHEPFQSIAEIHLAGHSSGNQSGDISAAGWNYQQYLLLSFVSGDKLPSITSKALSFAKVQLAQKQKPVAYHALSIYFHSCSLMGSDPDKDFRLNESDIFAHAEGASNNDLQVVYIIHQLMRSYVFKKHDEMATNANLFHEMANSRRLVRFFFLIGTFYEGLISFSMARRNPENRHWMERGEAALETLRQWSSFCMHNFENKVLLLTAERNFAIGGECASSTASLYRDSISSAKRHRFVNEEAIACELAASYLVNNNDTETAISLLRKARNLYQTWGASALVEITESKMDPWSLLFGDSM